jgi:hypothetical protein
MARARRRRPAPTVVPVDLGTDVPPELRDPDAAVWHHQLAYHRFMAARSWSLPPAERMGSATGPANRRSAAAAAWAVTAGGCTRTYGDGTHPHADWHALRTAGLID